MGLAAQNRRPRQLPQAPRARRVIAMGVGDENMGHALALRGLKEGGEMRLVLRARIDHREAPAPHQIGAGAREGEGPAIGRNEPPHQRRDLDHFASLVRLLVIGDVVWFFCHGVPHLSEA